MPAERRFNPPAGPRAFAAIGMLLWLLSAAAAARIGFWAAFGTAAIALGAGALLVDRSLLRALWPLRASQLLIGAASGGAMALAAALLYPAVVAAVPWVARDTSGLYRSFAALTLGQAALALLPIIVGEELLWRGLVPQAFLQRLPASAAVLLGATAYGLCNLPTGSPVLSLTAFCCGLVWFGLRVATGSLVAPLISHLVWNLLVLFVHPLARF